MRLLALAVFDARNPNAITTAMAEETNGSAFSFIQRSGYVSLRLNLASLLRTFIFCRMVQFMKLTALTYAQRAQPGRATITEGGMSSQNLIQRLETAILTPSGRLSHVHLLRAEPGGGDVHRGRGVPDAGRLRPPQQARVGAARSK